MLEMFTKVEECSRRVLGRWKDLTLKELVNILELRSFVWRSVVVEMFKERPYNQLIWKIVRRKYGNN